MRSCERAGTNEKDLLEHEAQSRDLYYLVLRLRSGVFLGCDAFCLTSTWASFIRKTLRRSMRRSSRVDQDFVLSDDRSAVEPPPILSRRPYTRGKSPFFWIDRPRLVQGRRGRSPLKDVT